MNERLDVDKILFLINDKPCSSKTKSDCYVKEG